MGILSLLLVGLLKLVSLIIAESTLLNREESSPYECGFECSGLSRVPFSFRYFFLTLLFLLFDLEVVLLMFTPFSVLSLRFNVCALVRGLFLLFLLIRLFYEYTDGSLEWLS